ncbi:xylulose kinase [Aplysia californica]|uniref:Xylulose kinase n=1 Tax=Aplysia californica TaxID=6500 RepID=A0ABM0JUA1_APLCA|nr:xylulose kinase [Aplysia californica]
MAGNGDGERLFLGFDFSTQQIKVLAVTDQLKVFYEDHVQFDVDLPSYKTQGGVHIHDDHKTVTAPTLMWVDALDLLLGRMKSASFPFHRVAALSGDGQQHGSVYWGQNAREVLKSLSPEKPLADQLKNCFSIDASPVWMDASTSSQCRQLEQSVGGPQKLSAITGSRAFERFTGNQIMKVFQTNREAYDNTKRISLVSSFAASLFLGDYAPIDHSDGTGMNLLDIWSRDWSPDCLQACGLDLGAKLGPVVHSTQNIGTVSQYMVSRYGFLPNCVVAAFVGDNPASLAGLAPEPGDVIVSLGTSDTVFVWLSHPTPGLEGHVFLNPIDKQDYMSLTCFKNGSLTRERIRDEKAGGSWDTFSEMLRKTPSGNHGNIGIYFDVTEIQPFAEGCFRFDDKGNKVESFLPEVEVRAVIESQFMARRVYAEAVGLQLGPKTRVIATGGASQNQAILQVLSDVFNSPVYIKDVPNSACLGNAARAKHTLLGPNVPFSSVVEGMQAPQLVASPQGDSEGYTRLVKRYQELEKMVAGSQ